MCLPVLLFQAKVGMIMITMAISIIKKIIATIVANKTTQNQQHCFPIIIFCNVMP
jgi:hypothetical protein